MAEKKRYLTKSRFKQALACPDKLLYAGRKDEYADNRDENEFLRQLAKGGIQVGELAKCYFPGGIEIETLDIEAALQKTHELMQNENVTIFEAAISFENLLIRVDVLEKKGNTLGLYEAKSKSYFSEDEIFKKRGKGIMADWRPYVYDIAFQVYVTKKAFPNFNVNGSLFLINKNLSCTVEGLYQKFLVRKIDERYKVVSNPAIEIGSPILGKVDLGSTIDDIISGTEDFLGNPLSFEQCVKTLSNAYQEQTKLNAPISTECKGCEYKTTEEDKRKGLKSGFEECWMGKAQLKPTDFTKPHIFEIWNFRKSEELLSQGRYFLSDLTRADFDVEKTSSKRVLPPHDRQWIQVERSKNPSLGSYVDLAGFQLELNKLEYPLHFIDFEATRNAIPYLKGFRSYTQLAFQFSHHEVDKQGNVKHAGAWIDTVRGHYPNFDFIRHLKGQLDKDNGSILIYSSYENSTLLNIYDALNSSKEADKIELMNFIKTITWSVDSTRGTWADARKMIDMRNWVLDFYYSPSMKGSNSIKVVLPAIVNDSEYVQKKYPEWVKFNDQGGIVNPYELLPPVFDGYDRLTLEPLMEEDEIADGGAAMTAFNLMQFSEMTEEEKSKIVSALLKYCELDTLAMVMLFEGLLHFGKS